MTEPWLGMPGGGSNPGGERSAVSCDSLLRKRTPLAGSREQGVNDSAGDASDPGVTGVGASEFGSSKTAREAGLRPEVMSTFQGTRKRDMGSADMPNPNGEVDL